MGAFNNNIQTSSNSTSANKVFYAGEAVRFDYAVTSGTGTAESPIDLTGYEIKASARAMTVTDNDLTTAVPSSNSVPITLSNDAVDGSCANSSGVAQSSLTTEASCIAVGGNVWTTNTDKVAGKFYVYFPSTILKDTGFTVGPTYSSPLYVAYTVEYTDSEETNKETRIVEADLLTFKWTGMFDITD